MTFALAPDSLARDTLYSNHTMNVNVTSARNGPKQLFESSTAQAPTSESECGEQTQPVEAARSKIWLMSTEFNKCVSVKFLTC